MNKFVAGRTYKEYCEDNKERIKQQHKEYRENNKDKVREITQKSVRKYRLSHQDEIHEREQYIERVTKICLTLKVGRIVITI